MVQAFFYARAHEASKLHTTLSRKYHICTENYFIQKYFSLKSVNSEVAESIRRDFSNYLLYAELPLARPSISFQKLLDRQNTARNNATGSSRRNNNIFCEHQKITFVI